MSKNLAEILASNLDYLKINNIEKAIGLNKTALVRMIARKEIPEKHKEKIMKWWATWVSTLIIPGIEENNKPEIKERIIQEKTYVTDGVAATDTLIIIQQDTEAIKNEIAKIQEEKIPPHRNTIYGRKSWNIEQQNRIKELQKQLNSYPA